MPSLSPPTATHLAPGVTVAGWGNPCQSPRVGSGLTPRNALSEETHADKARDFTGEGPWTKSWRVREPRRTALPHSWQSWVL